MTARSSGRYAPLYTVILKGAGGWKANENDSKSRDYGQKDRALKEAKEITAETRSIFITGVESMSVEMMHKIRDAVTNGAILRRFCMMMKKQDGELSAKPMRRFLMVNDHDT